MERLYDGCGVFITVNLTDMISGSLIAKISIVISVKLSLDLLLERNNAHE